MVKGHQMQLKSVRRDGCLGRELAVGVVIRAFRRAILDRSYEKTPGQRRSMGGAMGHSAGCKVAVLQPVSSRREEVLRRGEREKRLGLLVVVLFSIGGSDPASRKFRVLGSGGKFGQNLVRRKSFRWGGRKARQQEG